MACLALAALWPAAVAEACTPLGRARVESVLDPSDPNFGSRAIGIVEYETIASAPYLGVTAQRSMAARSVSWGDPPSDSLRMDEGTCGDIRRDVGSRTLFVVLDDGTHVQLSGGGRAGSDAATLTAFEYRFGPPVQHDLGLGLRAAAFARLWIVPLSVPAALLAIAAVADLRERRRRYFQTTPAVVSLTAGLVFGVLLSLPDPGWSSLRLVAGFWALSVIAMLAARFGPVSAIALVSGTALYGIGTAPFTGVRDAKAVVAFGVALLVVGASIQSTAPTKAASRVGHVAAVAGAAMISGASWAWGSLGGGNGPIFFAGAFAAVAAAVWGWYIERSHFPAAAPAKAGIRWDSMAPSRRGR